MRRHITWLAKILQQVGFTTLSWQVCNLFLVRYLRGISLGSQKKKRKFLKLSAIKILIKKLIKHSQSHKISITRHLHKWFDILRWDIWSRKASWRNMNGNLWNFKNIDLRRINLQISRRTFTTIYDNSFFIKRDFFNHKFIVIFSSCFCCHKSSTPP